MNPQKFSRGVPGALAEGPTARGTGGVISVLLPRERAWALRPLLRGGLGVGGPLGPFQTWMVTGVPGASCIAPRGQRVEPRCCLVRADAFRPLYDTNDDEDGLKMLGGGCLMSGIACGLSSFADDKSRHVRLPKSVAVGRVA
jgi:hypothetical protein